MALTEEQRQAMRKSSGLSEKKLSDMRASAYGDAQQSQIEPQPGGLLGNLLKPVRKTLGQGVELGFDLGEKLGVGDRSKVSNPFLSTQESQELNSGAGSYAVETAKNIAGIGSFVVPAGKGVVGATKMGLASGLLGGFGFSEEGNEVKDTVVGGILGGILGGTIQYAGSKLFNKNPLAAQEAVKDLFETPPPVSSEQATNLAEGLVKASEKAANIKRPGMAENIYVSSMPFSRYGKAFERFQPLQTAKTMIEDGIAGTTAQIIKITEKVTGKNGVISGLVREGIKKSGVFQKESAEAALNIVPEMWQGKYTNLDKETVKGINSRLASILKKGDPSDLFDFQRTLENEGFQDLLRDKAGKAGESAMLKIDLSKNIEKYIDKLAQDSGVITELSQNPKLLLYLKNEVSENLARKVANSGGDLRVLRGLQKDYYRMNQIANASSKEVSALGRSYFQWLQNIPVVGPMATAVERSIGVPLSTQAARGVRGATNTIEKGSQAIKSVTPNVDPMSALQFAGKTGRSAIQGPIQELFK